MSKFRLLAVMALLAAPAFAFASQGSGTGGDSAGSGTYLSSQGSGTGGDSISTGHFLRSQGSGTGSDSTGSGELVTGRDTSGSSYEPGAYTRQAIQQHTDNLNCLTSLRCLFNFEK